MQDLWIVKFLVYNEMLAAVAALPKDEINLLEASHLQDHSLLIFLSKSSDSDLSLFKNFCNVLKDKVNVCQISSVHSDFVSCYLGTGIKSYSQEDYALILETKGSLQFWAAVDRALKFGLKCIELKKTKISSANSLGLFVGNKRVDLNLFVDLHEVSVNEVVGPNETVKTVLEASF